jgi:trigger factor
VEVAFEKKDALNAVLRISIAKEDYEPRIASELKKAQKKVTMPGFRPGNAPMGMVKKMYAKSILVEEVNKIASDALFGYLRDNDIKFLAQPLMSDSDEQQVDFEQEGDFLFLFDIGLAPEIPFHISAGDKITKYKISVSDADLEKEVENILKRHAKPEDAETSGLDDVLYLKATELDESGSPLEGGIEGKDISTTPALVKDEATRQLLIGIKKDDAFTADIFKLFNDNETVISNSFGIPKEGVKDLNRDFSFTVTEIKRYISAELNQELFDQVFGPGAVKNEDEFRAKLKEDLEAYYAREAEQMFEHSIDHLVGDKHHFELPDAFLKRWLVENSEGGAFTSENIDEKFPSEAAHLRYMLVRNKVLADNNITITEEMTEAMSMAHSFDLIRRYGIPNPSEEMVKKVSENNKKEKGHMSQMADMAGQREFINLLKTIVTPDEKTVGVEEFYEIIRKHNEEHQH